MPPNSKLILPTVTIAAMSDRRVWVYLPGEPSMGAFVDEADLVAALRGMIEKEKK